jgi:hypothetical protein
MKDTDRIKVLETSSNMTLIRDKWMDRYIIYKGAKKHSVIKDSKEAVSEFNKLKNKA